MSKTLKTALVIIIVLVIVGLAVGGYFIWHYNDTYIGKRAAENIAIADAGLDATKLKKVDTEFEHNHAAAWYEVDIDTFGMDYDYTIDARTGEILNSSFEVDD